MVSYNAQPSQCLVKIEFCVWELPLSLKQPLSPRAWCKRGHLLTAPPAADTGGNWADLRFGCV